MRNKIMPTKSDLQTIPGVGKSLEKDLLNLGIRTVADLKGQDPEELYERSKRLAGKKQDRCLLYVFRESVYFAEHKKHNPEKLKWWNWMDNKYTKPVNQIVTKIRQELKKNSDAHTKATGQNFLRKK
jgi:nucleotidyltransferase/DNA polymerase involved in DNA repair